MDDTNIIAISGRDEVTDPLTDLLRKGVRELLKAAVEAERDAFLAEFSERRTPDGRAAVVGSGYHPERAVQTGIGPVTVRVPKVRAKDGTPVTFRSALVSPYTTVMDCAAGSGALIVGFAQRMRDLGFDPRFKLLAQATDRDLHTFQMLYIQLSAYDIPAEVIWGNSLTLGNDRILFTPAFHWFFNRRRDLDAMVRFMSTSSNPQSEARPIAAE